MISLIIYMCVCVYEYVDLLLVNSSAEAQTCKKVATKAVRNEATSGSIVEDLTKEIERLKEQLAAQGDSKGA